MAHQRRRFGGSSRRLTDWSASPALSGYTSVAAGAAALLVVGTPIGAGETIIRTRGLFAWKSDQTAASENQLGAFGMGVVTEQAATLGITAIPHPDTDASWDGWFYHTYFASRIDSLTSVGVHFDATHRVIIDSKAMRKVSREERFVCMVENTGTHGIEVYAASRVLLKPF